jgi:hypothetical protein
MRAKREQKRFSGRAGYPVYQRGREGPGVRGIERGKGVETNLNDVDQGRTGRRQLPGHGAGAGESSHHQRTSTEKGSA